VATGRVDPGPGGASPDVGTGAADEAISTAAGRLAACQLRPTRSGPESRGGAKARAGGG